MLALAPAQVQQWMCADGNLVTDPKLDYQFGHVEANATFGALGRGLLGKLNCAEKRSCRDVKSAVRRHPEAPRRHKTRPRPLPEAGCPTVPGTRLPGQSVNRQCRQFSVTTWVMACSDFLHVDEVVGIGAGLAEIGVSCRRRQS